MTESVTPPKERLVDPETGETPPLSPPRCPHTIVFADCGICAVCHELVFEESIDAA